MPNLHFFGANKVQILNGKDNMYIILCLISKTLGETSMDLFLDILTT